MIEKALCRRQFIIVNKIDLILLHKQRVWEQQQLHVYVSVNFSKTKEMNLV